MIHMEIAFLENQTVAEFFLLGFYDIPELHFLFFIVFTVVYTFIVIGNMLIIVVVIRSQRLHTPMYFFLANLSFLEILYTSTVVLKMLEGFLQEAAISVTGCLTQFFIFGSLATAECFLLAIMAYYCFLAICYPLRYLLLMGPRWCMGLVFTVWLSGFMVDGLVVVLMAQLRFCGNHRIDHFNCEFPAMIKLACVDIHTIEVQLFMASLVLLFLLLALILVSYGYIVQAVMRIKSAQAWHKALRTCGSSLLVVSLIYGIIMAVYIHPNSSYAHSQGKFIMLL
ncbi:olfactory receptor 11A1-like [Marmota flaviventris]|uniref:olfactory receptor 11A1-like n=1 Tax=Marmota flaviventris TaxID=93162 RepID=UPI003A89A884